MPDNAVDAPRGDHSFAELRTMLAGETPAAPAADAPKAEAAPAASGDIPAAEPAPASEPATTQDGNDGQQRGADGKFKPKAAAASAEPDEAVPAGVQKRIDKAVRAQREAERRAAEAEAKLANQGSRPGGAQQPANNAQPAAATPKPDPAKPETFKAYGETYEAYLEALTDWKVDQRRAKDAAEAETQRAADAQRKVLDSHNARVDKAKADKLDWDETMEAGQSVPITRELLDFIRQSEHGPDTAYYLLKNPEEMARVLALAPVLQVAEAGAIAKAQFEAKPASAATSPAPAKKPLPKPAAAIGGSAGAKQPDLNDPKLSMSEFKRLVRAEIPQLSRRA